MVKIKLVRVGVKNRVVFRIVVIDERAKKRSASLATVGFWQPSKDTKKIDREKIKFWQARGAKLTTAVEKLISSK